MYVGFRLDESGYNHQGVAVRSFSRRAHAAFSDQRRVGAAAKQSRVGIASIIYRKMNLYEAAHLARQLMMENQLTDWSFGFDHARRRFGRCDYTHRQITLSRPLTLLNSIDEVRDTILHEIAHALCPKDGHGAKWRAVCRRLGAKPARCYSDATVVSPTRSPAQYRFGCPKCNWWVQRRRRSRRAYLCKLCRGKVIFQPAETSSD
jgi:predicted SprT family Zn-dependent metalloprotease